jgi:multidrug resistance protein MdtO
MATAAQTVTKGASSLEWFGHFLKEELSPYPGRGLLVTRIVVATTVMMILTLVFRLPYGAYGAIFAMTISRENPQTTINEAKTIVVAFAFSVVYVLVGAMLFLTDPMTRFVWVIGTLFLMFYALRVLNNYTAGARFGYLLIITIPLWDEHISAGLRVENTLWAFGVICLASIIAALFELVYASLKPRDDLVQSIAERLTAVEDLLSCYAEARPVDGRTEQRVANLALVGTSRLRRFLQRSGYSAHYAEQMGAVVALVGRIIDIAANLTQLSSDLSKDDRPGIRELANSIGRIRVALVNGQIPSPTNITSAFHRVPLLQELEATASLVPAVFTGSQSLSAFSPQPASGDRPARFFVPDAFSNSEHIKFALRGCLAASLCYIIYNAKDWPGISTSVTTCFLTGLSTIGSSHQKQILRIAGAIVGGLVLGIGAQIFILPFLDSVTGFTLLFLAVTIPAVWVATSGPRLSYFGVQILVAFYLINLSEFKVQTSLVLARDRVIGIFLGLLMMWLAFDRLWGSPAIVEMKKMFIVNMLLLAQFVREPISKDMKVAIEHSYALRETINKNFENIRNLADHVVLEFGPARQQHLAWRNRIVRWQPQLRALFLIRIALWKYRTQLPSFELPTSVLTAQREFDLQSAEMLESLADRMEGKASAQRGDVQESLARLQRVIESEYLDQPQVLRSRLQTFLLLSSKAANLQMSLSDAVEHRA